MNRHVNAIAGRLSLRQPQRHSLEILDRVTEIVPPKKGADIATALTAITSEFPTVTDFERDFPSLCFALATGVGKTRLMGAFISYLHAAHGINHFFVLAPNLTIYNKLITDFTPNTSKYVFAGIAEFATEPPTIITGDNYESGVAARHMPLPGFGQEVHINIFNISKINSEVRGGKAPRIKRLSEYIGQSYFEYLAGLDDLVLLMDESHRYRASAGVRAINELKPVLGLELTATPFVESSKGPVPFKNVIYKYSLAKAMADGFVKEPAVVTQKNFNPSQFNAAQLEQIKLEDGVRLHENTKVELETYARQTGQRVVKPFMLIIARETTHAGQLMQLIQSSQFFEGRYKDKVIQVDSSKSGAEEDEMVQRLLAVESPDEPTEIVIHVNMLKEGWDVTNLYTIVPLRAANARTLIEQSIGRGLRLPYGKRTGVSTVDRLNIVAHDRFQEIIDEANKPDSVIRLTQVELDPAIDLQKTKNVVAQSTISEQINAIPNETERKIAQVTQQIIQKYEHLPNSSYLLKPEVQHRIAEEVAAYVTPSQQALPGMSTAPSIPEMVAKATGLVVRQTIDIPRITVQPRGEVTTGFHPFTLDCSNIHYQPPDRDLLIQHLRTREQETLSFGGRMQPEQRLEDYVVRGLVDFDDIDYDEHSDLLYDVSGQLVRHLRSYLSEEEDVRNVLIYFQKQLAALVHAQMQEHQWEKTGGYEVVITKGFTDIKKPAFSVQAGEPVRNFREPVQDKGRIPQMLFGGFERCLFKELKFQSDPERKLAVILDRDSQKWFRPASGQFQIFYKLGVSQHEYQPDFVAETADYIYMMEPKAKNEMTSPDVLAKKDAAVLWCGRATTHALSNGGKPWKYVLIPHDVIAENMTLAGLAAQFAVR
ncbi:MAG: DEAD/DEAH box helicase family protein [Nitrospira sp.]|nr:DEAD/DEAH box helicase family protein [Nitrospira sp.]MBH0186544.1 DEAD/DEAH box helicase family protein [Nitrospira sp.]